MVDFYGAPYSRSNCYLVGSKFSGDTAVFGIFLKLYALKGKQTHHYTSMQFITIFALQRVSQGQPQVVKSQKTKK